MQADSNRGCLPLVDQLCVQEVATATDGSPSGSGKSGRVPPLFSANSIHWRTSGESTSASDTRFFSRMQKSSYWPEVGNWICASASHEGGGNHHDLGVYATAIDHRVDSGDDRHIEKNVKWSAR